MKVQTEKVMKDNLKDVKLRGVSHDIVGAFIEELVAHENVEYKDVKCIGHGKNSHALKIGEYVLKVGETRETKKIKNNFRILQPVIRRTIPIANKDEKLFIEVQNEVEADWYKKIPSTEVMEVMYSIYKDIRDAGMLWTDICFSNVGRLKKDNKSNYAMKTHKENTEIQPTEEASELIGEPGKILKAGEYVILDTDYIFGEEEVKKRGVKNMLLPIYYNNFEQRYQKNKEREER